MNRLAAALALSLAAVLDAACATPGVPREAFSFAVMGDTPYSDREEVPYLGMMRRIDAQPVAFVIHVGDFKPGAANCSDELYARRKAQFDASAHPFVFTPGDNEWSDCRFNKPQKRDPLERLARLREVFFATPRSLGRNAFATEVQRETDGDCGAYPENRAWTVHGVRFVTLNVPGNNNNVGFDAASDAEALCRNAANSRWLESAAGAVEAGDLHGLVIAMQADPWYSKRPVYEELLAQLRDLALRLRKPVLLVHGDTHLYRFDTPFTNAGVPIANLQRLETYGSPQVGWVRVNVDPAGPELFRAEPKLLAIVPP